MTWREPAVVAGTWLVVAVGLYINAIHDQNMAMIVCVPVAVTAWVFGLRGAIFAGLGALPLSLGILALGSFGVGELLRDPPTIVGHVMTALVGLVIGYLSSLRTRIERETELRAQSERATVEAEMAAHLARADRLATMGTLASGVAHEINNPLTYLLSNLEFAHDDLRQLRDADGVDSKIWERLRIGIDESREAVERIQKITSELQLFVRDHPGTLRSVDMAEALGASIKLARHKLRDGSEVESRLEPVPLVRGDGGKLTQVFVNLLVNAAQAIPEGRGHGRIVVTLGLERGEKESILVTVTDDGQGMPAEVVSKIFEPFFTTKPRGVGTGLGLSVSASIIRNHGGTLECDSEPGRGTTFRVRLPIFGDAAPSVAPSEPAALPPIPSLTILIIDDDAAVRRSLLRRLAGDHTCEQAATSAEALARLASRSYDLILCDLTMPEVSGMELFEQVAAGRPELAERFWFVTGGGGSEAARAFMTAHAERVLDKPITQAALDRALRVASGTDKPTV